MKPKFHIDFLQHLDKPLPYLTNTRLTNAWGFVNGVLKLFGGNECRYTDDGLLVEKESTNLLDYSCDLTQDWTSPASSIVLGTIGIDGVNQCTQIDFAGNDYIQLAFSGTNIARTFSIYAKRMGNTNPVYFSVDNGSTLLEMDIPTDTFKRFEHTFVDDTFNIRIYGDTDRVLFDYAQLEEGDYATSPIYTSGTPYMRGEDEISMVVEQGNSLEWFNFEEGAFVCEFMPFSAQSIKEGVIMMGVSIGEDAGGVDGLNMGYETRTSPTSERFTCGYDTTTYYQFSNTDAADVDFDTPPIVKIATSYFDTSIVTGLTYEPLVSINGFTPGYKSATDVAIDMSAYDIVRFGATLQNTDLQSVFIKRFTYYDKFIQQAELNNL